MKRTDRIPALLAIAFSLVFALSLLVGCGGPRISQSDIEDAYEDGYERGYNKGREEGSEENRENGYKNGYEDGYADGLNDGYSSGYTSGARSQVTYGDIEGTFADGWYQGRFELAEEAIFSSIDPGDMLIEYQEGDRTVEDIIADYTRLYDLLSDVHAGE